MSNQISQLTQSLVSAIQAIQVPVEIHAASPENFVASALDGTPQALVDLSKIYRLFLGLNFQPGIAAVEEIISQKSETEDEVTPFIRQAAGLLSYLQLVLPDATYAQLARFTLDHDDHPSKDELLHGLFFLSIHTDQLANIYENLLAGYDGPQANRSEDRLIRYIAHLGEEYHRLTFVAQEANHHLVLDESIPNRPHLIVFSNSQRTPVNFGNKITDLKARHPQLSVLRDNGDFIDGHLPAELTIHSLGKARRAAVTAQNANRRIPASWKRFAPARMR